MNLIKYLIKPIFFTSVAMLSCYIGSAYGSSYCMQGMGGCKFKLYVPLKDQLPFNINDINIVQYCRCQDPLPEGCDPYISNTHITPITDQYGATAYEASLPHCIPGDPVAGIEDQYVSYYQVKLGDAILKSVYGADYGANGVPVDVYLGDDYIFNPPITTFAPILLIPNYKNSGEVYWAYINTTDVPNEN